MDRFMLSLINPPSEEVKYTSQPDSGTAILEFDQVKCSLIATDKPIINK